MFVLEGRVYPHTSTQKGHGTRDTLRYPPPPEPQKWVVRILLECFLLQKFISRRSINQYHQFIFFYKFQVLLPMLFQDKINIVETYVYQNWKWQLKLVKYLDHLCDPKTDINQIAQLVYLNVLDMNDIFLITKSR